MKREEEYIDLKEIILKYFRHWKLICMSALVCFVVAFCYYKITSPVYEINANILIKQDAKSSGAASLMKNFSFGLGLGGSSGIDDDLNIISSYSMFMRAVEMLNLNDIYTEKTLLGLKETDRYSENVFKKIGRAHV